MTHSQNKEELVQFLFQTLFNTHPDKFKHVKVFFAHGSQCHAFYSTSGKLVVEEVPQLTADPEEADTRLLLHCEYASQHQASSSVIIRSPDTDVFVVAVGLSGVMNGRVLFHTGRGNLTRNN